MGHHVSVITESRFSHSARNNIDYQSESKGDNEAKKSVWIDKTIHFEHKNWHGVNLFYFTFGRNSWFKKFRIWLMLWHNRSLIEGADVVHCHDVFFWYLPFQLLNPRKPVYITFHGYEGVFPPSKKAIAIRKLSEKLSWGNICVGAFIQKWYGTKADYVTHGGVDIDKEETRVHAPSGSKIKIVFVGRLEEDTGATLYLQVLQALKQKGVKFEFEACGDGRLRSKVEEWGKVHGFVRNTSPFLRKADIVFASSYLSILEAMTEERLVFAIYNNPLKRDYLRMAPFAPYIVTEGAHAKIVEKVIFFLTHPGERKKLVEQGHNWVKNQTWNKVVDLYLRLWQINPTKV